METGIQCKAKKLGERDYMGFIVSVDDGRYMWSRQSGIRRLSRGDAMQDANTMAHDCIVQRFEQALEQEAD